MPSEGWYRQIHQRLIAGDPVASTDLCEAVWQPLIKKLEKRHPRLTDSTLLYDAVSDALINYIKEPGQFDPTKRSLFGFLVMAAEGDLRNALAKASRRKHKEVSLEAVDLSGAGGKEWLETPDLGARIDAQKIHSRFDHLFKDPRDRLAVELMIDGERSTKAFADVWGLGGLPAKERASEVKRHKDRIKKMLHRHGERTHGQRR